MDLGEVGGKLNVSNRVLLVIALLLVFGLLLANISRYEAPVGAIFGGSTFLHLSIISSVLKGYFPWQDPHYINEFNYYPWLQHSIIALLSRITGISTGHLFNFWTVVQTIGLMLGYYILGKSLKDERLGVAMAILILLPRSTLRVELLPWPLYTSYLLIPLFVMFTYRGFNEGNRRFSALAGVILAISLLFHVFTFLMLGLFSLLYFFSMRILRERKPNFEGYFILLFMALLASAIFWFPLLSKYQAKTQNPTQELEYKLSAFKSSYPFIKSDDNPVMLAEDLVLNRIVSKVEGGEYVGGLGNLLLFALAASALLFVRLEREKKILLASFLVSALVLRFHGYLPLLTKVQPIRYTDFFEHALVMFASFSLYSFRHGRKVLMLILIFALLIASANFYYNANARAAASPEFGTLSQEHLMKPNGGRYSFLTEVANALEEAEPVYGEGVVLAHPISALHLSGLTGYKFVALPQGFSNVFVDVDSRVRDAKGLLSCRKNLSLLKKYGVRYVVADPLINSSCFREDENFKPVYTLENVSYPNPWRRARGEVAVYVYLLEDGEKRYQKVQPRQ